MAFYSGGIVNGVRVMVAAALLLGYGPRAPANEAGPVTSPITVAGHWLVDAQGRVVTFHGFNIMWKEAPYYPNISDQDAAFLADNGFNLARLGLIWKALEPQPGVYDMTVLRKQRDLDGLLGRYGIRTIIDSHQDFWSNAGPDWASPSRLFPVNFQNFWDDGPAADGVGVQTRFHALWTLIAGFFADRVNLIGYDTFNEPQPGILSGCSPMLEPCPAFEAGPLAAFYHRNFAAIRPTDSRHILFPEGVTQSGVIQPSLPDFGDPLLAYNAHLYCPSFTVDTDLPVACAAFEANGIRNYVDYTVAMNIPLVMTEFSSTDSDTMNIRMVDLMTAPFISWTAWAYHNDSGGGIGSQGLVIDDTQPGSEENSKPAKMDAMVVPYAQAIAGTPLSQSFDRATKTYRLVFDPMAVPGAHLMAGAHTQIFVPQRHYPGGYRVSASNARVLSSATAPWIELLADGSGKQIEVSVVPDTGSFTQRPLEAGILPAAPTNSGGSQSGGPMTAPTLFALLAICAARFICQRRRGSPTFVQMMEKASLKPGERYDLSALESVLVSGAQDPDGPAAGESGQPRRHGQSRRNRLVCAVRAASAR